MLLGNDVGVHGFHAKSPHRLFISQVSGISSPRTRRKIEQGHEVGAGPVNASFVSTPGSRGSLTLLVASAIVYASAATFAALRLPRGPVALIVNAAGEVTRYTSRAGAVKDVAVLGLIIAGLGFAMLMVAQRIPVRWLR